MTDTNLPCPELLRKLLRYEPDTGKLFWLPADRDCFPSEFAYRHHLSRRSSKEAFITTNAEGYKVAPIFGVVYYCHRVIFTLQTGLWPLNCVDHIDQDKSNNRWNNLREATRTQNNANKPSQRGSSSSYLGVSWHKASQKWRAAIKNLGICQYLGIFTCEIEAAKAYDRAALQIHREFANLNFPN